MSSSTSAAYVLAHRILPEEFEERLESAIGEWRADREGYLRSLWTRAALAAGEAAAPADRVPATGSDHDWPDGLLGFVVAMAPPHAVGDVIYCGVFWMKGRPATGRILTMEKGKEHMKMILWKDGKVADSGPAMANSPATFAMLAKMVLAHP